MANQNKKSYCVMYTENGQVVECSTIIKRTDVINWIKDSVKHHTGRNIVNDDDIICAIDYSSELIIRSGNLEMCWFVS